MAHIRNFHKVSNSFACSGQPTEEQLEEILTQQYHVVVNLGLIDTDYALSDEATSVKQLGMDYFHIPVIFNKPEIDDLQLFIKFMDQQRDKKVLVHCAANYRASCFLGLYLYYSGQMTENETQDMIGDIWQPDHIWQSYLEDGIFYIDSLTNK